MMLDVVYLVFGLALLFAGGEALVRGAAAISVRLGVPPMIIGLTVVGFGTSMPELLVSVQAALKGSSDIAVGNVVGSNIANILLILGIAAIIFPITTAISSVKRDLVVMLAAAALMFVLPMFGILSRVTGSLMVAALIAYLIYAAMSCDREEGCEDSPQQGSMPKNLAFVAAGLVALVFGADFLIDGATSIATVLGVSEAVIGLTIVAVGTSLPELAASAIAAFRRHSEIAIGNVIGSNIFNILGILGATAIIQPVAISPAIATFDIPVMIGVSLALVLLMVFTRSLNRIVGAAFVATYVLYCSYLFVQLPA